MAALGLYKSGRSSNQIDGAVYRSREKCHGWELFKDYFKNYVIPVIRCQIAGHQPEIEMPLNQQRKGKLNKEG